MIKFIHWNLHGFNDLFVTFKKLYGIPAVLFSRKIVNNCFFNMSKGMFNTAFKAVLVHHRLFFASFFYSFFCSFNAALSFKRRNFHYRATEFLRHSFNMNFIAVLFYNVHHVYGNNHWNSKLCKLSCKVKVAFKVCSVNNIKDCIRAFLYKIFAGNNFLKRIRRKRIYTRQVHDYNVTVVTFKVTFLLFYCYSRPVSYKLI